MRDGEGVNIYILTQPQHQAFLREEGGTQSVTEGDCRHFNSICVAY